MERILYDLSVPHEWPEMTITQLAEEKLSLWKQLSSLARACARYTVDQLKQPWSGAPVLPAALVALVGKLLPWKLALSSDGKYLAILREELVEIRSHDDNFEDVVYEFEVTKEPRAQWRKIVWNEEGTLLAISDSCGGILVATPTGVCVAMIEGRCSLRAVERGPQSCAVCGMAFVSASSAPTTASGDSVRQHSLPLLTVLMYNGTLDTYQLGQSNSHVHLHSISLLDYHPRGVGCMLYHSGLKLLLVGACPDMSSADETGSVSGWRLVDTAPYWVPMLGRQDKLKPKSLLSGVLHCRTADSDVRAHCMIQMSLSPSGSLLAAVDLSGQLSMWDVPSLKMRKVWGPQDQCQWKGEEEEFTSFGTSKKKRKKYGPPLLVDVKWWSDECLILVNTAGEVTVADVSNLENMLGSTPERGHAITAAHNGQFFMLECDTTVFSYSRLSSLSGEPVAGEEEEGEEEGLGLSQTYMVLRHMLYSLTENENFRPPLMKGRRKVIKYSLLCLKSVTPQECYERKMSKEEYGEALVLAKQYGLDCDLVYQRQWYNNPVTIATIQDYLSKVSKEEWVIQECMNRVARDYETTRELLQYGLVKTSFREVMECGSEGSDSHCDEEKEGELSLEAMEAELTKCERFTAQQTKLCQYRHILLSYMDSLLTYEAILGGPIAADEHFDDEFFVNFRSKNLVQATIEYAQEGNGRAVEILFTHHSQVILPHSLPVLSNFPETTSVKSYKSLLPYIDGDGGVVLVGLEQEPHRVQDWSELPVVRQHCLIPMDAHLNLGKFLYEETPAWKKYQAPVTSDVITTWYQERAREIEQYSGLVDNALALVELGIDNGIKGLDLIHHHLKTLYTLVYQCNCNSTVTLSQVESMSDLEKLHRMTKEARGSPTFITAFVQMAVPFLSRVEGMEGGKARRQLLEQCMVSLAKDDLVSCQAIFQQSVKKVVSQPQAPQGKAIIRDVGDMMSLALKCVYSCERCEQLDAADRILECLPMGTTGLSEELLVLHKDIDKLEDHLSAMEILNLYGTQKPISYIRNIQDSPAEAKQLMVRLTRGASRQPSSGSQETFWRNLLAPADPEGEGVHLCGAIYLLSESLLCSGQEANIQLASQVLKSSLQTPSRSESQTSKATHPSGFSYQLPYDKSVELVVYAAREYFNSAANYRDRDMSLAKSCLALILRTVQLLFSLN